MWTPPREAIVTRPGINLGRGDRLSCRGDGTLDRARGSRLSPQWLPTRLDGSPYLPAASDTYDEVA